jgi:hypothetical protein
MPPGEAQSEIARSIARVSEQLGKPCASFAFPNGNHSEELARYALGCGARTVMTTDPAWIGAGDRPWLLPRVQIYETQTLSRHRLKIFLASLGWLLSNPDGSGRRYVKNRWSKESGHGTPRESWPKEPARATESRASREQAAMRPAGD